jgi:hypothetical protein
MQYWRHNNHGFPALNLMPFSPWSFRSKCTNIEVKRFIVIFYTQMIWEYSIPFNHTKKEVDCTWFVLFLSYSVPQRKIRHWLVRYFLRFVEYRSWIVPFTAIIHWRFTRWAQDMNREKCLVKWAKEPLYSLAYDNDYRTRKSRHVAENGRRIDCLGKKAGLCSLAMTINHPVLSVYEPGLARFQGEAPDIIFCPFDLIPVGHLNRSTHPWAQTPASARVFLAHHPNIWPDLRPIKPNMACHLRTPRDYGWCR